MQTQGSKASLLTLLEHFETGMLCTRQGDGTLRARPMVVARVQHNGDVWFLTAIGTGKVEEVLKDPGVVVTFQSRTRFVSLSGRAEVVGDEQLVESLWRDDLEAFFPQGRNDPRLVLIHVRATEAEYWDERGARGMRHAFDAAKAALTGNHAVTNDEEHAHVML